MITLRIDNQASLYPLTQISGTMVSQVKARLTFLNPAYLEAEKRGFYTGNIAQEIRGYQVDGDRLTLPRGCGRQVVSILHRAGVQYRIEDRRRTLAPVTFTFHGQLEDFQETAVSAMAARDFGTLAAPTGSGKTVMALALIAKRRQPALIAVHTKELADQWRNRIETFLGIPAGEVGIIGGGKMKVGDKITVALVQSLYKCAGEVAPHIGDVVVDECHRTPSRTFTSAVMAFDCRYMTGLSATPWRRDGLSRLIYWHLGDLVHEVDKAALVDGGHVLRAEVIWRKTDFEPTFDPSEEYSKMLSELTQDPARNSLIAGDVAREAGNGGGVCLVLSDRRAHCEALVDLLAARGINAAMLTGDLGNGERQKVVEDLNGGHVKVLVATGQLIGEGFDCRELSTLFLATPIRFNGRLLQYIGRVLRPAPGKEKARVYDYVDPVGVLRAAAWTRARVYGPGSLVFDVELKS
jgi:superfamily II DNA or RNA helicase